MGQGRHPPIRASLPFIIFCLIGPVAPLPAGDFIRGDSNRDGTVDISDAQFTLSFLFLSGVPPQCRAAADANDDEDIDLSDAIATFGTLFLGRPAKLPLPGPLPGPDPTPGLGCGLPAPGSLVCRKAGPAVDLTFGWREPCDAVEIRRDGAAVATLPANSTSHRDRPPTGGEHTYEVRGIVAGAAGEPSTCRVTAIPANRPPVLMFTSPLQGAVVDGGTVPVNGRVSDETGVPKIVVAGDDATPAGPPATPYNFGGTASLVAGPNLVRVEAVDDFGRAAFASIAVGGTPILRTGEAALGLALDLTGDGGYGEIETILRPFLSQVPALLDAGIRGVRLYEGSVLGVDITVTGNRVEVTGPIGLDIFPSGAGGGRVGMKVTFETVRLYADGRSDYGFLGTDAWSATWTAYSVDVAGTVAFVPRADRSGLDVTSDGFTVTFGNSDLSVSGFLDPFGIFDGLVNFLASLFRGEIESQVRSAVEDSMNRELLPVLQEALGGLSLDVDLGAARLDTYFQDVLESDRGLSVLFGATWTGAARDPAFPAHPGSKARFAPYPSFPLGVSVAHPLDATICLSEDTLNQALLEIVAGGILKADMGLAGISSPIPLNVGTIASILDPRLGLLPGLSSDTPLGLRIRADLPPTIRPGEGVVGRLLLSEGSSWRYFKGTAAPPATWKNFDFSDAAWARGSSGFGYSSDPAERRILRASLDDMAGKYGSLFLRTKFTLADPATPLGLVLRVYYDDGFVAYVNGREVARVNMSGSSGTPPAFGDLAASAVEPTWVDIDLSPFRSSFRAGDNVLAVQAHNAALDSSDFVILPQILEPLPPPAGTLSAFPSRIKVTGLTVTFVADPAADGVGEGDADGVKDDVDLFAFALNFLLDAKVLLLPDEEGAPALAIDIATADGTDADKFPDAIFGGAAGIGIEVAFEAVDVDDAFLGDFAELTLLLFAASLGESLGGFEIPSIPLPELAFDTGGDGNPDVSLEIVSGTLAPSDTNGDGRPDWICILADLRAEAR
jgi:hypothetical protein